MTMNIGIIPQGGKDWIAGVVYVKNVIRALNLLPNEERPALYFILGPDSTVEVYRDLGRLLPPLEYYTFRDGARLRSKVMDSIRHAGLTRWPISLERLARKLKLSALFPLQISLGKSFSCSWVGWIPDFQHKRMPQFFSHREIRERDECFRQITREADHIIVGSQDAYGDLIRWFPTVPDRVSVFPFVSVPAEDWYESDPREIVRHFGLPAKYLIFPSQFWIHKNHTCLFEAMRLLADGLCPDIALVCTGREHDYRHPEYARKLLADLKSFGLERNVHCLGLLPRHTQIQLVRAAVAVIQPSWFEGWSALVEDARTLGKRIYVSDIPIHREQTPLNARFFDPKSPAELAEMIAADWKLLSPGPDLALEREALTAQRQRAVDFARLFLNIIHKASKL